MGLSARRLAVGRPAGGMLYNVVYKQCCVRIRVWKELLGVMFHSPKSRVAAFGLFLCTKKAPAGRPRHVYYRRSSSLKYLSSKIAINNKSTWYKNCTNWIRKELSGITTPPFGTANLTVTRKIIYHSQKPFRLVTLWIAWYSWCIKKIEKPHVRSQLWPAVNTWSLPNRY